MENVVNENNEKTFRQQLNETSIHLSMHFISSFLVGDRVLINPHKINYNKYRERNILSINDLKGKKFLFQRILVDIPNTNSLGGAIWSVSGAASPLEIIEFVFNQEDVTLRRSYILQQTRGHN